MADPAFFDVQRRFAAFLRDPSRPPPEDVPARRATLYAELAFANIRLLVTANFPVLHRLYDTAGWAQLLRDFLSEHRCRTPLFTQFPVEFVEYLGSRRPRGDDPPFLAELAHYEWMESALRISTARDEDVRCNPDGDLLTGSPVPSPLAWPLSYRFPVHRIGPACRPVRPPDVPTSLLLHRVGDGDVRFIEMNPVSARLLQMVMAQQGESGATMLARIAAELGRRDVDAVSEAGLNQLRAWRDAGVILGTQP